MEAYCVKCRTKRDMANAQSITMKNGRPAHAGSVPNLCYEDVPHRKTRIDFLSP